jgi:hypothetical protein
MLEAHKDGIFVAPGIGILYAMLNEAEPWGITRKKAIEWATRSNGRCVESLRKMHKRGIRVLPAATTASRSRRMAECARPRVLRAVTWALRRWRRCVSATRLGAE